MYFEKKILLKSILWKQSPRYFDRNIQVIY